jgi:hypothetical protein
MADTWDMTFLVDQTTQIQEARGNLAKHFGMLQQVLVGKHLLNFVSAPDRLAFLRMMGRLSQRNWTDQVAFRLRTPLSGEQLVALQARPGPGPMAWWLLIAESGGEALPLISEISFGSGFTSEDEFGVLARSAADEAKRDLDISVFRAAILADNQPREGLSPAQSEALEQKIGATLQENAAGGVVARPEPGQFALVHDKQVSSQQIAAQIAATAKAAGVSEESLGLSHQTAPLPAGGSGDSVRDLVRSMRQTLQQREGERKRSFLRKLKSAVGLE